MPFARALVILLALTNAVGLADLVLGDGCDEVCADDGCDDTDCPPGQACRCHGSSIPALAGSAQAAAKLDTDTGVVPVESIRRAHASPDPREILHVPRRRA